MFREVSIECDQNNVQFTRLGFQSLTKFEKESLSPTARLEHISYYEMTHLEGGIDTTLQSQPQKNVGQ